MTKRITETEDVTHETKNALDLAARKEGVPVEQLLGHVAPKAPVRYWGAALTLIICMTASFTIAWFWQAERLADDGHVALAPIEQPNLSMTEMQRNILELTGEDMNRPLGKSGGNIVHRALHSPSSAELIDYLATTGADFNFRRQSDGATPMIIALHRGAYGAILHVLIHHREKVDLGITNNKGNSFREILMFKLTNSNLKDPRLVAIKNLIEEA